MVLPLHIEKVFSFFSWVNFSLLLGGITSRHNNEINFVEIVSHTHIESNHSS